MCGSTARAEKVHTIRLRIGWNYRAVCTKKSDLNASGHRASASTLARDTMSNDRHENGAARFERPAEQALVLAISLERSER